jgi:hypothetical protein
VGRTDQEAPSTTLRGHRDVTLRQRIRGEESYGVLFVMIILSLTASAAGASSNLGRTVVILLQGGVLLFALWTTRSGNRALRSALVLVPVIVVVAIIVGNGTDIATGIGSATSAALTLTAIGAIVRRVAQHRRIDGATILGVLSVYLLIGTFFASVFSAVAAFSADQFFAQETERSIDFLYFSFVTLTTTGYGDLSASTDLGRMLAVTEALLGQLYLVSVVAIVVANVGRERRET